MAKGFLSLSPRKSFKVGGLKLNLSKGGVGVSTGIKGLRIGINSKGKQYVSAGTGMLRQTKQFGLKTRSTSRTVSAPQSQLPPISGKHKLVLALTLFLGWCGVHRFYMGNRALGLAYLLFCWTLIPFIVSMVEVLYFSLLPEEDFKIKYKHLFRKE